MKQKGRPKGANSFVAIDIEALSKLVPNGEVAVSKKFLAALGVDTESLQGLNTREVTKLNRKSTVPTVVKMKPASIKEEKEDEVEYTLSK